MINHCAVTCPVVTEAVKAASPESKIAMALAAVESDKISIRAAAERFGVHEKNLRRANVKITTAASAAVVAASSEPVTGKDGRDRRPPATKEEILKAWEMKDSGASVGAIALDLKRGVVTVRNWFKKPRPQVTAPTSKPAVGPLLQVAEPDPQPAPEAPAFALKPPDTKPLPISPQERKRHYSQIKWVKERWIPATKALMEARQLLKDENTRLGDAYRHRENGGKMFTIPYQRLAKEWEEKGHLAEIAEALDIEDQGLNAELLKLEEVAKELEILAKSCASMASGMRMFTGCRPDNNLHESTP